MKRLVEFLSRFKNLKPLEKNIEDEARKIIEEKIKTPEGSLGVDFKKPNLTISSQNPALKNEVFLYKEDIVSRIQEKFGAKTKVKVFFK